MKSGSGEDPRGSVLLANLLQSARALFPYVDPRRLQYPGC